MIFAWPVKIWAESSSAPKLDTRSIKTLYPSKTGTPLTLREAVLNTLEYNLDIQISRHTRDQRLTDIVFQAAQFDPTMDLRGRYDRWIAPLNRPIFGFGGVIQGTDPRKFDQNDTGVNFGVTQRLITGGSYGLTVDTSRNSVAGEPTGFLFNPSYESNLSFNLTQPLLRNFGPTINSVQITIARNSSEVEGFVFIQQVFSVIAQVEQAYWELVFARENLKVAQDSFRAAEKLLENNREMVKAGVMSVVDVLQAQAAVASRVEQIFLVHKSVKDQEDQLRQRFSPSEWDLKQTIPLIPLDIPKHDSPLKEREASFAHALAQRPEILQAQKNRGTAEVNTEYAKNQLLPDLSLQGIVGLSGLGESPKDSWDRMLSRDYYNMGGGLVLTFPLGNRAAKSQYDRRQLERQQQEAVLLRIRQQIILEVKEAIRQVDTNYNRIQTNLRARELAEQQLAAEHKRLRLGLSTTRSVLEFQSDLRLAQGREWRALLDYNQSLSRFRLVTASVLDHYHIHIE